MCAFTKYIACMSLAVLCACQKEPVPDPVQFAEETVRFAAPGIAVAQSSQSGPINVFPEDASFGVLGYCLRTDGSGGEFAWDEKQDDCAPSLFYNQEVRFDAAQQAWVYANTAADLKRWYENENYLYSFFAYYPYGGDAGKRHFDIVPDNASGTGAPQLTFSMPFDSQSDETTPLSSDAIPDAMMAMQTDVKRGDGHIGLTFYHLLAGIRFKVHNYNDEHAVTIHSLRMEGTFYKSISVTMGKDVTYPDETFKGSFELLTGAAEVKVHDSQSVGKTLMLVSNLNSGTYIGTGRLVIDYSFITEEVKTRQVDMTPTTFRPYGGTVYVANLNFIGDAFEVKFEVDNTQWEDGGDSDVAFN